MIKKINQYLILNYPQLWNTKVLWVGITLVVLHILFFIAGYMYFDDYAKLHYIYRIDSNMVESYNVGYSALCSFLVIIIWLVYYLRNNPFKSYYPLRKTYFITEFAILFFLFLGTITFYKSYAIGFSKAVLNKTADINFVEEANLTNIAYGFIPNHPVTYNSHNCCDSVTYRARLSAAITNAKDSSLEYYRLREALNSFDSLAKNDHRYSLLNFCEKNYWDDDTTLYSKEQIALTMQQWLVSGNKAEVAKTLIRFKAMCDKYKIDYNIDIPAYAEYAFADKNFTPSHYISNNYRDDYYEGDAVVYTNLTNNYQLDWYDIERALSNIKLLRAETFSIEFWLANLYLAFCFVLLLFTFRLTSVRVWLTAFIVQFGIMIAVGILSALIHEEGPVLLLLLIIAGGFYAIYFGFRNRFKRVAGVSLIWFTWCMPFIGITLYGFLLKVFQPETRFDPITQSSYTIGNPIHDFLTEYMVWLMAAYFVLAFIYTGTVLASHYRKWMALPEE